MTEREPIVSVITPTFNRAEYLQHAIESVLGQTVDRFELLVIDDGSTDSTPELMERYFSDSRIRYFQQPNQGQSVARNRGIKEARGDFICFLDSDNAWLPEKLEKSLEVFRKNPECHVVYGDYIEIDQRGKELGVNQMRRYSGAITPELLKDNFISMNTTMTRRECFETLGGFDEADRLAEDYGLWLRLSTQYQFYYLADVLGFYRVMEGQISSEKRKRLDANERILLSFLNTYPDAVTSEQKHRGLSHFYLRRARFLASEKSYFDAYRDIVRSIRQDALWLGPWRGAAKVMLRAVIP